ncbi:MAG: outer membrane protein assembly factor BamD [Myxococcota bacterium]
MNAQHPHGKLAARGMFLLLIAALTACGGAGPQTTESAVAEAEQIYVDGMEHLSGGSMIEAEQEFQKLLTMPSYLTVTSLALLRLGDAQFYQAKHQEAIETYQSFAQRHDGSENVPYALFMSAKAQVELAPSDLWFMPPAEELDLSAVAQARSQLERFIRQYPKSRYTTEALVLRDRCIDLEWQHHSYVVGFYVERGKWMGVVFRLHQAMQLFPARAHTLENYALLARAYTVLGWRTRAIEVWQAIATRWSATAEGQRATAEMNELRAKIEAARAKGEPAEMPADLPPTAAFKPEMQDRQGRDID